LLPWVANPVKEFLDKVVDEPGAVTGFPSTSTMATLHYRVELLQKATGEGADDLRTALEVYKEALTQAQVKAEAEKPSTGKDLFTKAISSDAFDAWRSATQELTTAPQGASHWPAADWLSLDGDLFLFGTSVVNEEGLVEESAIRTAYRDLLGAAKKEGVGDPPIYWALLTMDGDGMGDFLKRVAAAGIETTSVSDVLQGFAAEVPETVARHNGRAVYAGGDDVVAMFAVKDALSAADELRQAFAKKFEGWFGGLPQIQKQALTSSQEDSGGTIAQPADSPPRLPTLSGAIVYAHHQAPLSQVFASAHELLDRHAKKVPGKNAIALRKLQSGAAALTCAASWDDCGGRFADNMTTLVDQLKKGEGVSAGLLNGLRDAAEELAPTGLVKDAKHRKALLARRIEKSRDGAGETSPTDLASALLALADAATPRGSSRLSLDPLLLAVFLRGEGREAR
jgi:class 3 adenylate cyclase